ncbi:MAG: hypothetical protein ABIK89_25005 [Planctomycetota bacterium]
MTRCPQCSTELPDDHDVEFMRFDREYFQAHPDAALFVRPVFEDEHPFCCSDATAVKVVQVRPGTRVRQGAYLCSDLDPRAETILRPDPSTPFVFMELPPS